ncbi:MAG: hypothetical protein JXB24_11040 [Bacteroidales bacterium]|nr:hypothetical protein [Bacteroidales bacterium]
MNTHFRNLLLLILTLSAFSCKDKIEETYMVNAPVYLSYDELRSPLNVKSAQDIIQPGKLYFKDNFIYVNEYQEGIHVIDNQDPANPQIVKFIEVPGNVDLAIKGDILFADSYVDLVAIDISDLDDIKEVGRVEDAFPYMLPEYTDGIVEEVSEEKGIVIGWQRVEKTVEVNPNQFEYQYYPGWDVMYYAEASNVRSTTNGGDQSFGVGGSMARFTLYADYLYAIDNATLKLFNISEIYNPILESEMNIGWNIETIFPYNGKLFIGTMTGMLIYSLQDPANPEFISEFWHTSSCDPVVVENNYAYVTLRAGNLCGESENLLDVIDISDIRNPELLKKYAMTEPYGLGIDNSVLFVCDGSAGLKIFNAEDPMHITDNKLAEYPDIDAFDVIPLGDVLLMIGIDGLFQYDYSDLENINQLSHIPIYSIEN